MAWLGVYGVVGVVVGVAFMVGYFIDCDPDSPIDAVGTLFFGVLGGAIFGAIWPLSVLAVGAWWVMNR